MKNRRKKLAILLCTVLSSVSLWGCGEQVVEEAAEDVATVEASNPEIGSLKLSNSFIATINPDESVYIIPKTTAEVLSVNVKAGDVVQEGDVLAVLDDTIAQMSMKNAQLQLDNAQHAYNLSYGDAATTLNNMQTDSTLDQAADGVDTLQESLVDAMDNLQYYKDMLADEEAELADIKEEYGYTDDVDEIKDYAEDNFDKNNPKEAADYAAAMQRYQNAATKAGTTEAKISNYKSAIDQLEESIDKIQKQIDSTYNSYSQAVTSSNLSNGEMREEQKKVSQNSISAAQLGIEQAQESLDAYTITATISGVIETVNVSEHDFATSSSPAFVISNKDAMVATFYVSEDIRNTFRTGQSVSVEKDEKEYAGEIIEIGSAVDQTTGLFKVKVNVGGDTSALLSGTKATVTTDTYHENNAVIIPYDAVYYDGTEAYVYTVVDGKAKKTYVTTGLYDTESIVITEGLSGTDLLITTWSAQLRDGVDVSIIDAAAKE
ncbi:MAG: efflux RND transporter periplasmic adaptor subunit [Lachnospiraceae bacterium]|nr:efflux RND transporter periplasmic adaptor subunit [Lachnospiraceae bacterium]